MESRVNITQSWQQPNHVIFVSFLIRLTVTLSCFHSRNRNWNMFEGNEIEAWPVPCSPLIHRSLSFRSRNSIILISFAIKRFCTSEFPDFQMLHVGELVLSLSRWRMHYLIRIPNDLTQAKTGERVHDNFNFNYCLLLAIATFHCDIAIWGTVEEKKRSRGQKVKTS